MPAAGEKIGSFLGGEGWDLNFDFLCVCAVEREGLIISPVISADTIIAKIYTNIICTRFFEKTNYTHPTYFEFGV